MFHQRRAMLQNAVEITAFLLRKFSNDIAVSDLDDGDVQMEIA